MATRRKNVSDHLNDRDSATTAKERNGEKSVKEKKKPQTYRRYYFLGLLLILIIGVGSFSWATGLWGSKGKHQTTKSVPKTKLPKEEAPLEEGPRVIKLADITDALENPRIMTLSCPVEWLKDRELYPNCAPMWCGRVVTDSVVSSDDATKLLEIAKAGFAYDGSNGGASILDLHSGALSKGDKFVNIYSLPDDGASIFKESDFAVYNAIKDKIRTAIAKYFGIPSATLYLTKPTFFSRMTNIPAQTIHDEYWHIHVDKETYESFTYTSLLYLSDYGTDFTGGIFTFVDADNHNITVAPKLGRLSFFSSGAENRHFVEKIESGTRYAITVSFTCDETKAIKDPSLPAES